MFELYKKVNIDLSHLIGYSNLSYNYEVIEEDIEYHHKTVVNIGDDQYELNYLSDNKLLMRFKDQWYYMIQRHERLVESQEEFDDMVSSVENDMISYENDDNISFEFIVCGEPTLLCGTEYVKDSIDEIEIGEQYEILLNLFQCKTNQEILLNTITEGELLLYIGVAINNNQIL